MGAFDNFVSIDDDLTYVNKKQDLVREKKFKFGISFLDSCLGGIFHSDLILLGADSGVGKTELATNIISAAIRQKKKVVMFALEADRGEIAERIKYKRLARRFFDDPNREKVHIDYMKYFTGDLEQRRVLEKYEADEIQEIRKEFNGLKIRYRNNDDFSIENLEKETTSLKNVDLIVIDHMHYFDFEGKNENKEVKDAMKRIRDLTQKLQIPILLLAQLRKPSDFGKRQTLVPSMYDFMGSSDLYKIATKVILLGPGGPSQKFNSGGGKVFETYVNIAKVRVDGSRTRYQAKTFFDVSLNDYLPQVEIGQAVGTEWKPVERHVQPMWINN